MTAIETLRKARAWLAEDPKRWHQGDFGLDDTGFLWDPVDTPHLEPRCACAAGAILLAEGCPDEYVDWSLSDGDATALRAFAVAVGLRIDGLDDCNDAVLRIGQWNDAVVRTYAEVLDAFDRAIASLEVSP